MNLVNLLWMVVGYRAKLSTCSAVCFLFIFLSLEVCLPSTLNHILSCFNWLVGIIAGFVDEP